MYLNVLFHFYNLNSEKLDIYIFISINQIFLISLFKTCILYNLLIFNININIHSLSFNFRIEIIRDY